MQSPVDRDLTKPTYLVALGKMWKFLSTMTGNDAAVIAGLLRPDYAAQLLNATDGHRVVSELIYASVQKIHHKQAADR